MSEVNRLWLAWQLLRHLGPGWIARRAAYAAQRKLGWFEWTCPSRPWSEWAFAEQLHDAALAAPARYADHRRSSAPRFLFSAGDRTTYGPLLRQFDEASHRDPVAEAVRIQRGEICFFSHDWARLGTPPDWHRNPFTGQAAPRDSHWSRLGDFGYGDIKFLWEPARFASAYTLVRADWRSCGMASTGVAGVESAKPRQYWGFADSAPATRLEERSSLLGDEALAETFWRLVESWRDANPPFDGVHWKCEQETALRVMAWCFGLYGFQDSPASTDARITMLAQMIAVSGRRIACNLGYPLSQQNNHGMSAGMGLWTIGLLFPEFREAAKWRETGRSILERLARELIYEDGSFAQHSFNYQRLMLHLYLWSIRLGQVQGQPLAADVVARVAKSGEMLCQVQDDASGGVPNYGHNDGALILPLSNCDYQDFRPVVQATHYLARQERRFEPGAWDEDLLWLFGPDYVKSPVVPPQRTDLAANDGGYYTLRSPTGFAFIRCASFRHRPSQADQLHVDLWWRGQNIACDAGTYSYNTPPPWDTALADTCFHNTLTVDGRNQMQRAGRFLWLPWANGQSWLGRSPGGRLACFMGAHGGYGGLFHRREHRRWVIGVDADSWIVLDSVIANRPSRCRVQWLLWARDYDLESQCNRLNLHTSTGPYSVQWNTTGPAPQFDVICADKATARGWRSSHYGRVEPAVSLAVEYTSTKSDVLATVLSPRPAWFQTGGALTIGTDDWHVRLTDVSMMEQTGFVIPRIELLSTQGDVVDFVQPVS